MFAARTSGGASYGAKGLKLPPPKKSALSPQARYCQPRKNQAFGASKTLENPLAAGASPRISAGGAYSAPPNPLAGGKGAGCPLPKNLTPALGLSGLELQPFRPLVDPAT